MAYPLIAKDMLASQRPLAQSLAFQVLMLDDQLPTNSLDLLD